MDLITSSHTLHLFGLAIETGTIASIGGWLLFAGGALRAARQHAARTLRTHWRTIPPLANGGVTLAAMAAGLGLLLMESYPSFARTFCFPYALLALAASILGRAMQAGGRPIGEE